MSPFPLSEPDRPRDTPAHRPVMLPDDQLATLMLAVQRRCVVSFERLYVLTSPKVYAIVLRINRDRGDAEELLQDIYVSAWSQAAQFDALRGPVMHWLCGIAHHRSVSSLRARGRRVRVQGHRETEDDTEDVYATLPSDWPRPEEHLARTRADRAVHGCLDLLPDEQRRLLQLAFLEGLSHQEIAKKVDKPLGTVKSLIRRALTGMRPALELH